MHIAQLWVNLPARAKMSPPRYQTLLAQDIPVIDLPLAAGTLRVIAGSYEQTGGPARTFTPVNVWDTMLRAEGRWSAPIAADQTAIIAVLRGTIVVNHVERVGADNIVVFARERGEIVVDADTDSHLLILSGEPLNEPIVGHGPFVMNSNEEIQQAISDLHRGDFGEIDEQPVGSADRAMNVTP